MVPSFLLVYEFLHEHPQSFTPLLLLLLGYPVWKAFYFGQLVTPNATETIWVKFLPKTLTKQSWKAGLFAVTLQETPSSQGKRRMQLPSDQLPQGWKYNRPNNKHTQPLKCQEQINALLPSPDRRDPRDGLYLIHEIWASGTGFSLPAAVAFLLGEQELCYLIPLDLFHLLIPSHWLPKVLFFFFREANRGHRKNGKEQQQSEVPLVLLGRSLENS